MKTEMQTLTPEELHKTPDWENDQELTRKPTHSPRNYSKRSMHIGVQDVVDRLPNPGSKGAYLKQMMRDKLIEHKHYIVKHGEDLPEIRNWKWSQPASENAA